MTVHRDVLKLERVALDATMASITAKQRALVAAWVVTYDQVSTELLNALDDLTAANVGGTVSRAAMLRSQRLMAALRAVEDALDLLAGQTGGIITDRFWDEIADAVDTQVAMMAAQLPAQVTAGTLTAPVATSVIAASPEAVDAMVNRVTERITKQSYTLATDAKRAIRTQLLRSIAVGDNPRVAARRALRGIEGQWNGGLTRAMVIARTEQIDAHRAAAKVVQDANADVLAGWTWVAHLGPRTCKACVAMHGTEWPLDTPGPQGHQQCRCSRVPRAKTWAELGITGMRERKPALKDKAEWFNGLPAADQQAILGKTGYAAWKAGKYPIDQWATKQSNTGWRDSYVPTRPPST